MMLAPISSSPRQPSLPSLPLRFLIHWSYLFILSCCYLVFSFFFQAEDGIRDWSVTGVQTCALPISLHADGANRRQDAERLPQLAVEPGTADLVLQDRVGLAQGLEPLHRDVADDPDREARPRERLAPDHALRHPELLADAPHLVLEEQPQRLDELHLHVGRQPADVVVRLDRLGDAVGAAGLDHVRVERSLDEPADVAEPPGL